MFSTFVSLTGFCPGLDVFSRLWRDPTDRKAQTLQAMAKQTCYIIKSITFLTLFLGHLLSSFGQNPKSDFKLSGLTKLDIGGQGIGLTYEPRLSNKMTADISAGAGGGYNIAEESIEINYLKPAFYFSLTPKYFYNRQSRIDKGKTTLFNSGNYIGLRLKYVTPIDRKSDLSRNSILANLHWGVQRVIENHWTFNSHIGLGYARDIDYGFGTIYPAIDFKLSYIFLNSKK
jgi:hypothetical protein